MSFSELSRFVKCCFPHVVFLKCFPASCRPGLIVCVCTVLIQGLVQDHMIYLSFTQRPDFHGIRVAFFTPL